MKFKVGDKVKYIPNWSLTSKSRLAIITSIGPSQLVFPYAAKVKYSGWIEIDNIKESEFTLLSPVEALLYDWEGYQ